MSSNNSSKKMHASVQPELVEREGAYRLVGDITFATIPAFKTHPPLEEDSTSIDLTEIGRVDSAGLALLVEWVNFAKKQQKSINFVKIPAKVDAMIQMRGLRGILYANRTSEATN